MKYVMTLVALLSVGCGGKTAGVDMVPYYDLASQLRKQIKVLYDQKAYLVKYVIYNEKPEQVITHQPDWNKEFDPFFEVDIHAPALIGLYSVDTTRAADSTLNLVYKAKGDDEAVRELDVNTNRNGDLLSFKGILFTGSMLNKVTRTVTYERFKGFRIDVDEKSKFSSDNAYTVKGEVHLHEDYFE